ncbi:hypothetical protein GCM10020220_041360 [Nonomuraea rubra]|uniref:tetratricopeptide repeat protein n=1 Tax=Nonomuraea rubra TaxID=46180 RepID=UPI0031ED77D7
MERLREADELAGVRERAPAPLPGPRRTGRAPAPRRARQQAWLGRLDAEAANFRSALQEAVLPDAAARLATALCWWWLLRGRLNEGRRVLSAVLDAVPEAAELRALSAVLGLGAAELRVLEGAFMLLTGDRSRPKPPSHEEITDPVRRGRALWLHAYGLFHAGLPDACEEVSAQALGLLATDDWGTAAVLGLRAMNALARGDLDTVTRDGLRGAALFRELGDRWGELQTVSPLATLAEIKGDYPEAARRQTEGLRIAEELGLAAEVAARLSGLGRLALLSHDWDRARDLHERALRLAVEQGYVYGEVHAVMGLALGARRSGDLDAAEAHLARLRDELVSSPAGEHLLLVELGFTAELRGGRGAGRRLPVARAGGGPFDRGAAGRGPVLRRAGGARWRCPGTRAAPGARCSYSVRRTRRGGAWARRCRPPNGVTWIGSRR